MKSDFLKQKMDQTKDMALNRILIVLLFFMAFGITVSLLRVPQTGFKFIYGVQIFLALVMVFLYFRRNRLSTLLKGSIFLIALYGMGLSSLLSFGLYGFGYAYFIPASAIAYLYFKHRIGWIITASSLLILVLTAVLFHTEILFFRPENPFYMESIPMWMNMIITVLLIAIVITMFWNNLYSLLNNTFLHIYHQQNDMKKMNDELIEARDKALQSDRMKSSFLQNISHEIRTPLNIIIGFSDMMAQTNDPDEHAEFNKVIRSNSNTMLKIVNDIVDFSKIETNNFSINKTSFNVKEALTQLEKNLIIDGDKNIQLEIGKLPIELHNDKERFQQIIGNLLDNAIRFTSEGSVRLQCIKNAGLVHFRISDSGIGIKEEEHQKIFERFYRVDHFSGGAGLGLSLSQSIASFMGGKVELLSSAPGQGSVFEFSLPYDN